MLQIIEVPSCKYYNYNGIKVFDGFKGKFDRKNDM